MGQWRHPEFCFRGAKDTFPNIGGANYEFTVIKSQILQVLKHPSPPCCDATALGDTKTYICSVLKKLIEIRLRLLYFFWGLFFKIFKLQNAIIKLGASI